MANLSASMEATTELRCAGRGQRLPRLPFPATPHLHLSRPCDSAAVNDTLAPRRERIKKLAGGHLMLKKLQFLFELPARLNQCVKMGALGEAVAYYARAARVLHHYREMDSFKGCVRHVAARRHRQSCLTRENALPRALLLSASHRPRRLSSIYDECTAIVAKLQETLQEKADSPELDQQEVRAHGCHSQCRWPRVALLTPLLLSTAGRDIRAAAQADWQRRHACRQVCCVAVGVKRRNACTTLAGWAESHVFKNVYVHWTPHFSSLHPCQAPGEDQG